MVRVPPLRLHAYCCLSWIERWMFGWMERKTDILLYLSHFHRSKTVTFTILVEHYCISVTEIINQITFYDGKGDPAILH